MRHITNTDEVSVADASDQVERGAPFGQVLTERAEAYAEDARSARVRNMGLALLAHRVQEAKERQTVRMAKLAQREPRERDFSMYDDFLKAHNAWCRKMDRAFHNPIQPRLSPVERLLRQRDEMHELAQRAAKAEVLAKEAADAAMHADALRDQLAVAMNRAAGTRYAAMSARQEASFSRIRRDAMASQVMYNAVVAD